jgi:Xaa-Pro aminopeptidase
MTSRLDALQSEMRRTATALVIVGPTANLRYLLGYRATAVERLTVLLVAPHTSTMILPDFDEDEFQQLTGYPEDVHPWPDDKGPAQAVADAFDSLGGAPPDARMLIDDELPYRFLQELHPFLDGTRLGPASDVIAPMRMRKSTDEHASLAAAGDLVSGAIEHAFDIIEPGRSERWIAEQIRRHLVSNGAESTDYILVQAGAASAAPHHLPSDREVMHDEPILVDIAARVDGYFADTTQQVYVGTPSDRYHEAYDAVWSAQQEAVTAAVPGIEIQRLDAASNDVLEQRGFPRETRTGHGIGLDVHEPPYLVAGDTTPLAPGMTFTIEPGVYLPGEFGIRIEDTVFVDSNGIHTLTRASRPLVVKS